MTGQELKKLSIGVVDIERRDNGDQEADWRATYNKKSIR